MIVLVAGVGSRPGGRVAPGTVSLAGAVSVRGPSVQGCGEADVDLDAAAGPGSHGHQGAVCVGDRLHDREAEPDTPRGVCGMACEALEGLEETLKFAGRDQRTGVGDGENGTS
jgi:hypothetical protein